MYTSCYQVMHGQLKHHSNVDKVIIVYLIQFYTLVQSFEQSSLTRMH